MLLIVHSTLANNLNFSSIDATDESECVKEDSSTKKTNRPFDIANLTAPDKQDKKPEVFYSKWNDLQPIKMKDVRTNAHFQGKKIGCTVNLSSQQ